MKKNSPLQLLFGLLTLLAIAACKPDPVTPTQQPGIFQLEFAMKWGANDLVLSQKYAGPDGRNYQIDALKFYISRIALLTPTDSVVNVKDVALVDMYRPDSKLIADSIPAGTYTGLRFNIGLDYALNHSNQSSYPTSHPLSTVTGMYWTWSTQYIFSKIEGKADTTGGNAETVFLYHIGTDSLLRAVEMRNLNLVIGASETKKQTLTFDLQQVFWSNQDTIDVNVDRTSQTVDNPSLAARVADQMKGAIYR